MRVKRNASCDELQELPKILKPKGGNPDLSMKTWDYLPSILTGPWVKFDHALPKMKIVFSFLSSLQLCLLLGNIHT